MLPINFKDLLANQADFLLNQELSIVTNKQFYIGNYMSIRVQNLQKEIVTLNLDYTR